MDKNHAIDTLLQYFEVNAQNVDKDIREAICFLAQDRDGKESNVSALDSISSSDAKRVKRQGKAESRKLERQERVFAYICEFMDQYGYPPTVREIAEALDIRSTSTVHLDIKELASKGKVSFRSCKSRAITPIRR